MGGGCGVVTVGMDYDVLPGREGEFEALWTEVVGRLAETPGHQRSRLFREVGRPHTYLILSEWSDQTAFTAFTQSLAFRAVIQRGAAELLAGPPRHRVFG